MCVLFFGLRIRDLNDKENRANSEKRAKKSGVIATTESGESHEIHMATEALNAATESFAAKRMDASVQRALAGQNIDAVNL